MHHKTYLAAALTILLVGGCTWIKPTTESEKVRVLSTDEVSSCNELGTITASLLDKVIGIKRNQEKVQKELKTLARNSAASMRGDTVVPISDIHDGEQTFTVYKCVGVSQPTKP